MASLTYSDYLFIKHRWLLVVRRVFPHASLDILDDGRYGLRLHISVTERGGKAACLRHLSYSQLNDSEYARQVVTHTVRNLVSHLLEDAWRKTD